MFFDAREPDEAEVLPCNFPIPSSTSMEFLQIGDEEEEDEDDLDCVSPAQSFRTLGKERKTETDRKTEKRQKKGQKTRKKRQRKTERQKNRKKGRKTERKAEK